MFVANIPNFLTLARLATTPFIAAILALHGQSQTAVLIALGLVMLGAILDKLDGVAARLLNQESDFGKLWDPIVDKLWLHTILLVMLLQGMINPYFVWLALMRDLMVTDLRSRSHTDSGFKKADRIGKLKFRTQVAYVVSSLVLTAFSATPAADLLRGISLLALSVATYFTIASAIVYTKKYSASID